MTISLPEVTKRLAKERQDAQKIYIFSVWLRELVQKEWNREFAEYATGLDITFANTQFIINCKSELLAENLSKYLTSNDLKAAANYSKVRLPLAEFLKLSGATSPVSETHNRSKPVDVQNTLEAFPPQKPQKEVSRKVVAETKNEKLATGSSSVALASAKMENPPQENSLATTSYNNPSAKMGNRNSGQSQTNGAATSSSSNLGAFPAKSPCAQLIETIRKDVANLLQGVPKSITFGFFTISYTSYANGVKRISNILDGTGTTDEAKLKAIYEVLEEKLPDQGSLKYLNLPVSAGDGLFTPTRAYGVAKFYEDTANKIQNTLSLGRIPRGYEKATLSF